MIIEGANVLGAIDILDYDFDVGEILGISSANSFSCFEYVYDYQGRRISKKEFNNNTLTKSILFVYDGNNVVAEYEDGTLTKKYLWGEDVSGSMDGAGGVGGLLAVNDTTENYYTMYDGNGNIVQYLDETQTSVAKFEYTPFGALKSASGTMHDQFNYRFSTKYQDNSTGLTVYRYRNYNANLGKWQTRDPLGEHTKKKQFNLLYGFVNNNSINFIDILGLESIVFDNSAVDCHPHPEKKKYCCAGGEIYKNELKFTGVSKNTGYNRDSFLWEVVLSSHKYIQIDNQGFGLYSKSQETDLRQHNSSSGSGTCMPSCAGGGKSGRSSFFGGGSWAIVSGEGTVRTDDLQMYPAVDNSSGVLPGKEYALREKIMLSPCKYDIEKFRECIKSKMTSKGAYYYAVFFRNCYIFANQVISDCKKASRRDPNDIDYIDVMPFENRVKK